MSYREFHELPYQSGIKEKFLSLGPLAFSLEETGWVALGVFLSYKMVKVIPPIPLMPFPVKFLHYIIPAIAAYFFSRAKHPRTGIPLWKYFFRWAAIRRRQRTFYYRRINIVKGGDRYF